MPDTWMFTAPCGCVTDLTRHPTRPGTANTTGWTPAPHGQTLTRCEQHKTPKDN